MLVDISYVCLYIRAIEGQKHDSYKWKYLRIFSYYKVLTLPKLSGLVLFEAGTLTIFKCTMQKFFTEGKWQKHN